MDDDMELLAAWRSGDERAGGRLVERHYAAVERFFVHKVADEAAADLIQRTFLSLVEARERIRADANFKAYLLGIARNLLYNYFRRYRRDADHLDFVRVSSADLAPSAPSLIAQNQESRLLFEALRRIPLEFQVVLELYYWENLKARELAGILGIPEGTARTRIRRAKILLEQALKDLSKSPDLLRSTVSNLEQWARQLRGLHNRSPG